MSEILQKVVLIGASGTVGHQILTALISHNCPPFTITILPHPTSTSTYPSHPTLTISRTPWDLPSLTALFTTHHAVIHAGGIVSLSTQPLILEATLAAHCPRLILNEYAGSNIRDTGLPELALFRLLKRQALDLAKQATITHPEFSWSALSTGNFIDYTLLKFPQLGIDIRNRQIRLVDDGDTVFSGTTLPDIGLAIRGILLHPSETRNKFCHVRSLETTQRQILEALKTEMGDEGWEVHSENSGDMYERGKRAFESGDQRGGMPDLLGVQLYGGGDGGSMFVSGEESDGVLLGVGEKGVGEVVRDVLRDFEF